MKKQQLLVVGLGFIVLVGLFEFGRFAPESQPIPKNSNDASEVLDFPSMLAIAKQKLTPAELATVMKLENSVTRGDVRAQKIRAYEALAAFWGDTARIFVPFAEYTAEAAELENSKESLTFAANLLFDDLQTVQEAPLRSWEANRAKDLFNKVLILDPADDSAKVGYGSCFIFGGNTGAATDAMQGIMKIREVAMRDTNNMYAQYMLGIASVVTGQTDKAIGRFQTVLRHQPDNLDALMRLADLYGSAGNKPQALACYRSLKSTFDRLSGEGKVHVDTAFMRELDNRIDALQ